MGVWLKIGEVYRSPKRVWREDKSYIGQPVNAILLRTLEYNGGIILLYFDALCLCHSIFQVGEMVISKGI